MASGLGPNGNDDLETWRKRVKQRESKQEFKISFDEFVFRCSNPNYRHLVDGWLDMFPPAKGQDPLRYAYDVMLPNLPVGPRVDGEMRCGDHLMRVSKAFNGRN